MTGDEAVVAVIDALESAGVGYMLVGSLATNFYGVPRATQDADFVIQLGAVRLSEVIDRLGLGFRLERHESFETIIGASGGGVLLFHLSDDDHDQERFRRRRRVTLLGRHVSLPTAEDMIITKLRWAITRAGIKDREDVRDVVAIQGERLDWGYIHSWADRHGTRALLDEIRRETAPETTGREG